MWKGYRCIDEYRTITQILQDRELYVMGVGPGPDCSHVGNGLVALGALRERDGRAM
jgi:hypothetical protein